MFTIPTPTIDCNIDWSKKSEDGKDLDIPVSSSQPSHMVNAFGWPINDMAALAQAQSAQEAELLLSRIEQYKANNPDNSNLSVEDMIRVVSPRSFQCPSEVALAARYVGELAQEKASRIIEAKQRAAAQKAELAKAAESSNVTNT